MDTKCTRVRPVKRNNGSGSMSREGCRDVISPVAHRDGERGLGSCRHTRTHMCVFTQRNAAQRNATQRSAAQRAQHRFDRNQSAISRARAGSHGHECTYNTHPRVHARKVRGEARTVDGRFDVAAAPLPFRHPEYLYIRFSRSAFSLSSPFSLLCVNVALDRRLTAVIFFPSTCSPFCFFVLSSLSLSLFVCMYAYIQCVNFIPLFTLLSSYTQVGLSSRVKGVAC